VNPEFTQLEKILEVRIIAQIPLKNLFDFVKVPAATSKLCVLLICVVKRERFLPILNVNIK
jgi:hypothetical protein